MGHAPGVGGGVAPGAGGGGGGGGPDGALEGGGPQPGPGVPLGPGGGAPGATGGPVGGGAPHAGAPGEGAAGAPGRGGVASAVDPGTGSGTDGAGTSKPGAGVASSPVGGSSGAVTPVPPTWRGSLPLGSGRRDDTTMRTGALAHRGGANLPTDHDRRTVAPADRVPSIITSPAPRWRATTVGTIGAGGRRPDTGRARTTASPGTKERTCAESQE
jgi:hypothetical protein